MEPDPMDRLLDQRSRWGIYAVSGAVAVIILATAGLVIGTVHAPSPVEASQTVPAKTAERTPPEKPSAGRDLEAEFRPPLHSEPGLRTLSPEEEVKPIPKRLADAFEAATGHRNTYGITQEGHPGRVSPLKIVQLPFGPALFTRTYFERTCGRCDGTVGSYYLREKIGIYYLSKKGGKFSVKARWPDAVSGMAWADAPIDWELTERFTAYPAIFASTLTSFREGLVQDGASLTELRPAGPIESDYVSTLYSSDGRPSYDTPVCIARGRITNIRKDRSFDLVVTGSEKRRVDHFVKRNGKFEIVGESTMWSCPCGVRG